MRANSKIENTSKQRRLKLHAFCAFPINTILGCHANAKCVCYSTYDWQRGKGPIRTSAMRRYYLLGMSPAARRSVRSYQSSARTARSRTSTKARAEERECFVCDANEIYCGGMQEQYNLQKESIT